MWELLYETFWDRLEHFCYKLCRDEARAEDLTQEVFLRALQNRTLIDAFTERQCKAWLFAAARNLYCDQVRRAAKEEALLTSLLPPDGDDSANETAASALGSVELGTVLDQLSELDRLLFTLRYDEGYTSAELSRLFELPPGTVRRRLSQTRHLLKTNLTED